MKAWRRGKEEAQWGRTLEFYAKGRVWEAPADPAADCPELEAKLQANRVIAKAKMSKVSRALVEIVLNSYVFELCIYSTCG